jgi:tight adherence protein C
MIITNNIFLLVLTSAIILSTGKIKQWKKSIDKKEHKLYFLYPIAEFILTKTSLNKYLNKKFKVSQGMKALHITNKPELWEKIYWYKKISMVILILYLFSFLAFLSHLQKSLNPLLLDGRYLIRPGYGEGKREVDLRVSIDEAQKDIKNKDIQKRYVEDIAISVDERSYKEDEIDKVFDDAHEYLKLMVLGDNKSEKNIDSNLNFIRQIPETSIKVNWEVDDYTLIAQDGTVNNNEIGKMGKDVTVTAILSYQKKRIEYDIKFHIMPRQYDEKQLLMLKLKEIINMSSKKSQENYWLKLPNMLQNYHLRWEDADKETGVRLVIMGILIAILMWFYMDKQLQVKLEKRRNQMLMDYPEIINKFTLLVNAGMTVNQAFSRIAEDYKSKVNSCKKRYAYEEMLITVHELRLGVSKSSAYEAFGRRAGQLTYMKFCSLIIQNLKKGNKGLSEMLNKEAAEAFEDRKENAKRLGEEAGTKLLVPMFIMLITVFIIILFPVFLSIQV